MSTLYVVATPIGNIEDITLRAIKVLSTSPYIVTEDIQKSKQLLLSLSQRYPMLFESKQIASYLPIHDYNEEEVSIKVVQLLKDGSDVALISEAGTPLVSDPGFKVVKETVRHGFPVISIPGVSSPIAALSASGLPTDKFMFVGYLPKSDVRKQKQLRALKAMTEATNVSISAPTFILFESPHRLIETLENIQTIFGDCDIVIARELTKVFEEIEREPVSYFIDKYSKINPKGEFVLLFNPSYSFTKANKSLTTNNE